MKLALALLVGIGLVGSCTALLRVASAATDAAAIAGAVGLIIAGALLGLTALAWSWRRADTSARYTGSATDASDVYAELPSILADEQDLSAVS